MFCTTYAMRLGMMLTSWPLSASKLSTHWDASLSKDGIPSPFSASPCLVGPESSGSTAYRHTGIGKISVARKAKGESIYMGIGGTCPFLTISFIHMTMS